MPFHLDVVTAERSVFSDDVDSVVAPGAEGEFGVLPHHEAFLTALDYGELRIAQASGNTVLAVGGGFLEVRDGRAIVLADSAERSEEIDMARAEAARERAKEQIAMGPNQMDLMRAEAALRRAEARIRIARRRPGQGVPHSGPSQGM
ncbi:MAG: F0F1 ATP synthase subunit epsilon [Dehalococcoidia bacterium]|nr:F0F1 ATP synthase subunit epsilon [Dehalococcoidia bacterium]